MAIDRDEIEKVASLAKLQLDENTITDVTQRLSDILNMVDQLQAADTEGVDPLSNPLDATQRLRPDVVTEENQREKLQGIAPATEQGLFLVPRVIE